MSPEFTKQYRLEIISNLDGLKDYDSVIVAVNPHRIVSMNPNPTNSLVTIKYNATGASSGYIILLNQTTAVSDNYILNPELEEITIDMTQYELGLYSIIFICDGEIQDSKNLVKY